MNELQWLTNARMKQELKVELLVLGGRRANRYYLNCLTNQMILKQLLMQHQYLNCLSYRHHYLDDYLHYLLSHLTQQLLLRLLQDQLVHLDLFC